MNNNVLECEDIPQVAMDAMNEVHREELTIVNQINDAIEGKDTQKISLLCQSWLEHTKAHFAKENKMMETYSFPAYHCHHQEHVEALDILQSIINSWEETKSLPDLSEYIKNIWPNWYVNHISTMDTVTSAFIKQHIPK